MDLPLIYHPDYVAPLPPGHCFPMSKFSQLYELLLTDGTVNRTCIAVGGTILTAQLAISHGLACNMAFVTHHAFPNYGSGFCIFNDLAIAARVLQKIGLVQKVLILDLDVHQGDGTAFIFQEDPTVFTFSMHCEVNFPGTKQKSDLDVPLPLGMEDEAYLQTLAGYLSDLLSLVKPDLVLYDAGVDVHVGDRLGKLSLTDSGIYRREMQVLSTCIAQGYPVACVIGGGYAEDLKCCRLSLLLSLSRRQPDLWTVPSLMSDY